MSKIEMMPSIEPEHKGEKLWLITVEQFHKLPDGTKLLSIDGEEVTKGIDYIDEDDHAGGMAFGFLDNNKPAGIDFDEKRTINIEKKPLSINESLELAKKKGLLVEL